ncbi:DUF362 domain-containing protein [Garciella nitratireducens]|uniref:Ferredoxin n=1 Tax=Garciella nitratireducens DSM 15102 TaxID=1121911 RepID=A0A1T4KES2_9FIRM|nr:DUF362 domain-containing protein [Garciella nitratireducens]RBP42762.1 hypothetical protein DFR81_10879 [Garciella nitratireducens]SJZ40843.1 hypothetical protein SAMN02745973_00487 [Garciella nitratireducens DSM 15102]
MKSKVYYSDFRANPNRNLLQKFSSLLEKSGMAEIDFQDKIVAIKMHFGEPGNLSYLRPNYAKVVADFIKEQGGKPFLTDCNTLYVGRRKNALEHLNTAYENGFSPFSTGCQIIIGDGLKGTDEALVPINGEYIKKAKIGHAIMDADILISLTHFKGHESTGFGGTLKNIGMGCGSRSGKMEMHNAGKPSVHSELCHHCSSCFKNCAQNAISYDNNGKAYIDHEKCVGCGRCIGACNFDAIKVENDETNDILNCKIAEYAYAVLKDRPNFHISLVVDVSPYCDCHPENDVPIVPDVGMFASFDPVALDAACVNAVNKQPIFENSLLGEKVQPFHDHFTNLHPETNWRKGLEHAEKIGLGSQNFKLIKIK